MLGVLPLPIREHQGLTMLETQAAASEFDWYKHQCMLHRLERHDATASACFP